MQLKKKKISLLEHHFIIQSKSSLSKSICIIFQYGKWEPANKPCEDNVVQVTGQEMHRTPKVTQLTEAHMTNFRQYFARPTRYT